MALAADDRVVLLGQDIAGYGGVFKATEGLVDEFGTERVRNTPIIESEPSAPPSGWRSPGSGRSWRCSSATS